VVYGSDCDQLLLGMPLKTLRLAAQAHREWETGIMYCSIKGLDTVNQYEAALSVVIA
jgi:hypothetical protein